MFYLDLASCIRVYSGQRYCAVRIRLDQARDGYCLLRLVICWRIDWVYRLILVFLFLDSKLALQLISNTGIFHD